MRARGEEPVFRDGAGEPYEIGSLWQLPDGLAEDSYFLAESLIPGAMAAAGKDSTLFSNRDPRPVDAKTQALFNEFFQKDNSFLDTYGRNGQTLSPGGTGRCCAR